MAGDDNKPLRPPPPTHSDVDKKTDNGGPPSKRIKPDESGRFLDPESNVTTRHINSVYSNVADIILKNGTDADAYNRVRNEIARLPTSVTKSLTYSSFFKPDGRIGMPFGVGSYVRYGGQNSAQQERTVLDIVL